MKAQEEPGTTASSFEPTLASTKLHAPPLGPGLVTRQKLLGRLVSGHERKLTLICAPAGWGKSMVLGEWCASPEENRPFAWLSLDPTDQDPVRFWSYAICALRSVRPEVGAAPMAALRSAGPDLVDGAVVRLRADHDARVLLGGKPPLVGDLAVAGSELGGA